MINNTNLRRSTRKRGNDDETDAEGEPSQTAVESTATTTTASEGAATKRIKLEADAEPTHQPQSPKPQAVMVAQPSQPQPIQIQILSQPHPQPQTQQAKPHQTAASPVPAPLSAGAAAMAAVAKPPAVGTVAASCAGAAAMAAAAQPAVVASSAAAASSATVSATIVAQPQSVAATATVPPATVATINVRTPAAAPMNGKATATTTLTAIVPPLQKRAESPPPPLKSLTFHHLQKKYSAELDYMLVEFRKLERQLLGAPVGTTNPKRTEAAGSKERREKLHGFILHLEDTIRQITEGCAIEEEEQKKAQPQQQAIKSEEGAAEIEVGSSTQQQQQPIKSEEGTATAKPSLPTENFTAAQASLAHLTPTKEKEESVQRLEEHILANLLPVKIRLTRQLAAQKGAARNPATAPVQPGGRGGAVPGAAPGDAPAGGLSFAAAAEAKKKAQEKAAALQQEKVRQQEAMKRRIASGGVGAGVGTGVTVGAGAAAAAPKGVPSQYGKPIIAGASSSLTSRLHGRVLGPPPLKAGAAAAIAASTVTTTGTVADPTSTARPTPTKRPILYAGMAPGSSQVPSSVNAVSGVHPGLIGADAARAVSLAEEERKRIRQLEESAARVALGINTGGVARPATAITATAATVGANATTTTTVSNTAPSVGPATLAARARALALAAAGGPSAASSKPIPRPNQPLPTSSSFKPSLVGSSVVVQQRQPMTRLPGTSAVAQPQVAVAAAAAQAPPPLIKAKPKKPHTPINYNDPSLTSEQQFELRLQEARWRQRKRRRERRRLRNCRFGMNGTGLILQGGTAQQQVQHAQALAQRGLLGANGVKGPTSNANAGGGGGGAPNGVGCAPNGSGVAGPTPGGGMTGGPPPPQKKPQNGAYGPRTVEYVCAMCNECYPFSCEMNPWWALSNHDCPKCHKGQIPRLDITAPNNAMEYHPALMAHLDDGGKGMGGHGGGCGMSMAHAATSIADGSPLVHHTPMVGGSGMMGGMHVHYTQQQQGGGTTTTTTTTQNGVTYITRSGPTVNNAVTAANMAAHAVRKTSSFSDSDVSHTDESDGEGGSGDIVGGLNYDESSDEEDDPPICGTAATSSAAEDEDDEKEDVDSVTREEQVEREEFGFGYKGETLSDDQARRLLVLIEHASTCPGRHQSAEHRNVCHSTKYLMLHIRDCSGLLSNGDICPFPWCRKVKHLLYHLVSCEDNDTCTICCPNEEENKLSANLTALVGLNVHRRDKFRERVKVMIAKRQQLAAAAAAARASSVANGKASVNGAVGQHRTMPVQHHRNPLPAAAHPPVAKLRVAAPAAATAVSYHPQRSITTTATASAAVQKQPQHLHNLHRQQPATATPATTLLSTVPNPASVAVAAAATSSITANTTPANQLSGLLPSTLSVSALPTLEEAALEIGEISLSTSDLMGPSGGESSLSNTNNVVVKTEGGAATAAAAAVNNGTA